MAGSKRPADKALPPALRDTKRCATSGKYLPLLIAKHYTNALYSLEPVDEPENILGAAKEGVAEADVGKSVVTAPPSP